ncbi:MAG TPA: LuxR C-terminal-related transcriptional regulator, partial [Nitrospiria bacterium]|nr:LuxR C-terminal-related transcriptional regulator [Nitrospiria bacterium]
ASGQTPSEIGEKLNLSVKTISSHRSHIMDKLDLKTSADLTRYAIRHELIEP